MAAMPLFMSAAPRPYSTPSRMSGWNGSECQAFARPGGHHVGVAGKTQQRRCLPAHRPEVVDLAEAQSLDPEAQRFEPRARSGPGSPASSGVTEAPGDQFLSQCNGGGHRSLLGRQVNTARAAYKANALSVQLLGDVIESQYSLRAGQ